MSPSSERIILLIDRQTEAEIGQTRIQVTPNMDELAAYYIAAVAVTRWCEQNGRSFNSLDWVWQSLPTNQPST